MRTAVIFSVIVAVATAQSFPPVNLPSRCAATLCLEGTTCIEVENKDGVIQARCVGPEKPGSCPASDPSSGLVGICAYTCDQDSDCKGSDKCCKTACGGTSCQPAVDIPPACENVKCQLGEKCVLQEVHCVRAPCHPQPTCVDDTTKPGRCPPRPFNSFFQVGTCASNCAVDGDCEGNQKCCKNGCGANTCQAPEAQITLPPKPSCATVKCGFGEKCVLQQVQCIRSPCYPLPVCVKGKSKPGLCPVPSPLKVGICTSTCTVDSECEGNKKCCKNGCGASTCQAPEVQIVLPPKPSCATVKCGYGKKCVLRQVHCVRAPCHPQPTCVDDTKKPGVCPEPSPYQVGVCASNCAGDSDCEGNQKCCKNGCGANTCQAPELQITLPPKPSCATVKCGPGEQCVIRQIYCFRAPCPTPRPVCMPRENKPGVCPRPENRLTLICPRDRCSYDHECPRAQKCCRTFCGARCLEPIRKPNLCATVDCLPGYACVVKKRCDRTGCSPRPTCEPVKRWLY